LSEGGRWSAKGDPDVSSSAEQPLASDPQPPRLEVRNVSKTFAGRRVLRDVRLTVRPGELHGLIGQNGSGKSTLAKVISGYHAPDPGAQLSIDGAPLRVPVRLKDLRRAGVSIVYQDLGLIAGASVVQNVRIGTMRRGSITGRVDWRRERHAASTALERLGFRESLNTRVEDLAPADRARVAVARALQDHHPGGGLIVFDESTRALPLEALEDFYRTMDVLLREGTAILHIGHQLGEILRYCDRVSVLRDGALVADGVEAEGLSEADLARSMLGRSLAQLSFPRPAVAPAAAIAVRGLHAPALAQPLDLDIGEGEIVGLTGLPGSGFEAIPYLLAGAEPATAGELGLAAKTTELRGASVAAMVRRGVVLVPEDRLRDGLARDHDMLSNITLPWMKHHGRAWSVGRRWRVRQTHAVIDQLGVAPANPGQLVSELSGGNQQKVLLGKWLAGKPRLLLVHEPTQAVDVNARQDLLRALHRVASEGAAVVIASTEVADLELLCNRVLVFRDGLVVDELTDGFDETALLDATYRKPGEPAGTAVRAHPELHVELSGESSDRV
jgi:ribose transport system ATP-binding protein